MMSSLAPIIANWESSGLAICVQVGKIGGLDAYFAEPKSTPKAGVMLIHDIHGWDKKNIRLVADKYADAGIAPWSARCMRDPVHALACWSCE